MKDSLIPEPQRCSLISTDFSVLVNINVTVGAESTWCTSRRTEFESPHLRSEVSVVVCTCNRWGTERQEDCWGSLATSLVPGSSKDSDSREEGRKWWNWTYHVFLWPLCAHEHMHTHICIPEHPLPKDILWHLWRWQIELFPKTLIDTEPFDYLPTQGRATGLWYSMCVTHVTMASLKLLLKWWNIGPMRSTQPEPEFKIADFEGIGVLLICLSVPGVCRKQRPCIPVTDSYKPCGFWRSNPFLYKNSP